MTAHEPGATVAPADGAGPVAAGGRGCLNCGAPLGSPAPPFCPQCGQDTRLRSPTVGEFVRQVADQYMAADGKLWRTLGLLLARPGALTQAYLAGRRRHYVLPLRLYLTISLLVLLGVSLLLNARVADLRPRSIVVAESHFAFIQAGPLVVGVDHGRFYCSHVPAALCRRLEQRLMVDPSAALQRSLAALERTLGRLGTAMAVLMPVFALLMRLAYTGQRWRYAEHLVFALHVHCFWLLALGLVSLGVPGLAHAAGLAIPVYGALAAWRIYGGPWWALALRLAAVAAGYTLLLVAALIVLYLGALLQ